MKRNKQGVFAAVCMAAGTHRLLTAGTLLCAAASVLASLLPPLLPTTVSTPFSMARTSSANAVMVR